MHSPVSYLVWQGRVFTLSSTKTVTKICSVEWMAYLQYAQELGVTKCMFSLAAENPA